MLCLFFCFFVSLNIWFFSHFSPSHMYNVFSKQPKKKLKQKNYLKIVWKTSEIEPKFHFGPIIVSELYQIYKSQLNATALLSHLPARPLLLLVDKKNTIKLFHWNDLNSNHLMPVPDPEHTLIWLLNPSDLSTTTINDHLQKKLYKRL